MLRGKVEMMEIMKDSDDVFTSCAYEEAFIASQI